MKKQFSFLLFLLIGVYSFAQECGSLMTPISIQERVQEATHVIEGEVTSSNAYWDSNKHNIYTVHTITTYKSFKGQSNASFKIVTMGGQVGNQFQRTSSAAQLQPGMTGTFFIKSFRGQIATTDNLYELVGAAQGVVKYNRFTGKASDIFTKYDSKENDLYSQIQSATGTKMQTILTRPFHNETSVTMRANPIVYSFSPLTATAGTQTVLTITGNNFGDTTGTVSFSNANDGGATMTDAAASEILSWSNTLIEVEIPYLAGTGIIAITHTDGSVHQTTVPLTIEYSHNNLDNSGTILGMALQDIDGNGGYTFAYHTDFDTSSAKLYFEEAFGLWNCESNINFSFGNTTTTDESVSDGINIVRFDNGSELASGVLGVVTTRFTTYCATTNRVRVDEIDITWNDSTNWYYGNGTPSASQYDFKTAALHELGHAHQLGHVINSNVVMHYSLGAGDEKYTLEQEDTDGAVYTMGIFTESTGCGNTAMSEKLDCCDDISINNDPQDTDVGTGDTVQFSPSASDYDTVQWYVSTDGGNTYTAISDDSNYAGTNTETLTINNTPLSFDGYQYAAYFTNICNDTVVTTAATLSVTTYTSIPDTNFEAALEALGYDNISGDGQVPTENINTITSLDVSNKSISDLTGIEDFAALETLEVYVNNLTSIDVSNISFLEHLNVSDNDLTTLNVSNNPDLRILYAGYNEFTTIDVSNNTALTTLYLLHNSLTAIDVTNNVALEDFQFHNNSLTTIDLSTNTELDFLSGRDNNLASLDVSNNPLLEKIWCGGNAITSLDISNNPSVTVIQMAGNDLSYLNVQNGNNTNVTSFDITNNPNLTCVLVDDASYSTTNWTSIDAQSFFSDTNCNYTAIPDSNFEAALEALGYDDISGDGQVPTSLIESVTNLVVSSQSISDLTGIADFISLESLEARDNNISAIDISNNLALITIKIQDNNLTSIDVSNNTNMEHLAFARNSITSVDVSNNPNLERLFFANNPIASLDLTNNPNIERIGGGSNDLSYVNVQNGNNTNIALFTVTDNPNLTCILVDDAAYSTTNWTDVDDIVSFSDTAYCRYTTVPDANFEAALEALGYDDVSGDGQVPTALIENVTSLQIGENTITDVTGLEDFVSLTELELYQIGLPSIDLSNNTLLEKVNLNNNPLTSLDVSALVNLTELEASSTNITSIDVSENVALEVLDLSNNSLSLLDLSANNALHTIYVNDNNLYYLNIQNGNNTAIASSSQFNATSNASLSCIQVDDATFSSNTWTNIDNQSSFSTSCGYTFIPDSNFETALNDLGYDDVLGDQLVPTANISAITSLEVDEKNIADLTGIQDFTSLTYLNVRKNNLTELSFTYNTLLDTLKVDENDLTLLDITNNPALISLDFDGNNLTSIDVSQNINLEDVNGYDNNLAALDLTNNVALREIYLQDNNLTSIDVANNTALETLYINSNQISSLDLSNNTNLMSLSCASNNLTLLDLSNNTQMVFIQASSNAIETVDISTASSLQTLYINGNNLTALDVSNNTQLELLNCQSNSIASSIDLNNHTLLEQVNVSSNNLTSLNIQNGNNINITSFNATSNTSLTCILVDDVAYSTTNWSGNIDAQTSFNDSYSCIYTAIPDANFEAALDALGYDDISGDGQVPTALIEGVSSLDVSSNSIADLTGIEAFTSLQVFYCESNLVSAVDLNSLTNLIYVSLSQNALSSLDVSALTNLQILDCSGNNITTLDLSSNVNLDTIDARYNDLTSLTIQNGNNTHIGLEGFQVQHNDNLTCILVDNVSHANSTWTDIDAQMFFTDTYCDYTAIPDANFEAALEGFGYDDISGDGQVPTALIAVVTSLNVSGDSIADLTGIEDFAVLQTLNVSTNNLTSLDLSNNTNLEELTISDNVNLANVDVSGCVVLERVTSADNAFSTIDLSANTVLEAISVSDNDTFSEIDLSNNTSLRSITLKNLDNLSSVDVRQNTSIDSLEVTNNLILSEFNVQNGANTDILFFKATSNDNLTCILVDDASYSTTNWSSIDNQASFSATYCRYTTIPDTNFEAALEGLGYDDISGDGQVPTALIEVLTSLDVRSLNISDLTGIEDFVALETLYFSDNNISSVDISTLVNLQTLWGVANNLTTIDVSNNVALTDIRMEENQLTTIDLSVLTNVVILQLNDNQITSLDVSNCPSITRFRVYNNKLSTLDLSNNPVLQEVRVSGNELLTFNLQNGNNTNISTFGANGNFLSCILVDDAAYSTTNWTDIDTNTTFNETVCEIVYTAIPDANFEAALEALGYDDITGDGQVPTALIEVVTSLDIENAGITDLTGIEDFSALTTLTVSQNSLGTLALSNSNLTTLTANYCDLTSIDISQQVNLEVLRAHTNNLTTVSTDVNTALRQLDIYGNSITTLDVTSNPLLEYLSIFQNEITTLDLSNNVVLEELDCENNNLTELDLSLNSALTILECKNNELTDLNLQNGNNTNMTAFDATGNPDLLCILVDDEAYSTTNWTNIDNTASFSETICTRDYTVSIQVFLQGALLNPNTGEENLMRDDLRVADYLPTTSPYSDAATCDATVFDTTGNDAIVDWVFVELRDATNNTTVVASQSFLLQRDGDVVTTDGDTVLTFALESDSYYVTISHRNHLSIMTISEVRFSTNYLLNLNFTSTSSEITYGTNAQTNAGMPNDVLAMWCGNTNDDSVVQYSGTSPDVPNILSLVLNDAGNFLSFPTYSISAYDTNDINMDGVIQYSGTEPDTPYILQNVLAHPSNFLNFSTYQILEQMPENLGE